MSVGISQVGFDSKVLEDEEEDVYQQEEKEREQEIRNLIINELDDNLLDDDNASFSSHDFHSTSNSRASQLDDSDLQPKDNELWNRSEFAEFPPRRGVFEKPPLMTERATNFVTQTTGSAPNQDVGQQPGNYYAGYDQGGDQANTPQYEGNEYQTYQDFGSYHGNSTDSNSNGDNNTQNNAGYGNNRQPHGYNLPKDYNGNDGYQMQGVDTGYNQPGTEFNQGQSEHGYYGNESGHHLNAPHDTAASQQTDGHKSDDHSTSFPGNYRVQYVPGYRPQHDATAYNRNELEQRSPVHRGTSLGQHSPKNTVWRDLRQSTESGVGMQDHDDHRLSVGKGQTEQSTQLVDKGGNERTSNIAQLQILYQARGRKIEELSEKLNEREEEMGRQIRVLNHQLIMLKDEHKGMNVTLVQSQQLVQEKQQDIKTIQDQLNSALKETDVLQNEKQELLDKFNAANSTIDCLNEQVVQLSRADSLSKAREQHESILNTVRKRQEDEILRLKQKLDDSQNSLNWKTEEANRVRGEVMEKADIINRLNRTLDDSQRQCQELLKTGTVTEITNLRTQLQDTISAKSKLNLNCTSLTNEISSLKEELAMYQNALKYGFGDPSSESFRGLSVVRNLNTENWATPKTHSTNTQGDMDAISGLRKELEHSLSLNQTKSQTIKDLERALENITEKLEEEKKKMLRMEKIVVEQEVKVNDLKSQLQLTKTADQNDQADSCGELRRALDDLQHKNQTLKERIQEIEANEQQLSEDNLNLKTQMAEMVAEYDEDKRISLEKCRDACLHLHEDAKEQLRNDLEQEKEQSIKALRDALEDSNNELVRVKECYVELSEESRTIEKRVREQVMEEMKQNKDEPKAVEALRTSLENQHQTEMQKAHGQWKKEHEVEVMKTVKEETKKIKDIFNEEKAIEIKKVLEEAEAQWNQRPTSGQLESHIAKAKVEWIQDHERDTIKRVSEAISEASKTWREQQNKNIKEQVDKAVKETEKLHKESRDREVAQALSKARIAWQRDDEESRQREIEHEVEVAVTNAVAEAKRQWDINNTTHDKHSWRSQDLEERQNAIESAVVLAEVKWLQNEQAKISRAVDTAVQAVRASWAHEKEHDIVRAVADASQQWKASQEQELNQALEEASGQLVDKFDEQKREAVEMALREAKTLWQRNYDQNNNANVESIRNKLWSEFEETKQQEFQETLEEERNKLIEEHEQQKQEEINGAITYLESQYAKGLEEFKHKELRNALAGARADWEKEQESEVEEVSKKRIDIAREEWLQSLDNSSRSEVDRALATAREAWAAEYEDELEDRVNAEVDRVRERFRDEMESTKMKEIDEAVRNYSKQFDVDERKLKDEINRLKVLGCSQSVRKHYENEISLLNSQHQRELHRVRDQHDEHTRVVRESVEEEFDQKLVAVLHDAKQLWEEEQEEDRIQVEDQHKQKIKAVLENARVQFLKDQEKAVKATTEAATNRQKELLKAEREAHKTATDKIKEELTRSKQQHEAEIQRLESKHSKEVHKLTNVLNDRTDTGTQTPPKQDSQSICDSSFGSIDQLTAVRTMHELRDSYLDTVAKIRDDVLDHVRQTKTNAAKKIRNEVLKERHSTAKKLRRYYLQCLKQMLEEDKACAEMCKTPSSLDDKLERMNKALDALTPEPSTKGQSQDKPNKPTPTSCTDKETYTMNGPNNTYNLGVNKLHCRPGGYGPDGASDSSRPSPSDKTKEIEHLLDINSPTNLATKDNTITLWPEKDISRTTEHVSLSKPPSVQQRIAGSPALSVTSLDSEQYTDLPTVIPQKHTDMTSSTSTPITSSKTRLDEVKARALARSTERNAVKPISISAKMRGTGDVRSPTNQKRGVKSRDGYIKNTPPLPSKPSVHTGRMGYT